MLGRLIFDLNNEWGHEAVDMQCQQLYYGLNTTLWKIGLRQPDFPRAVSPVFHRYTAGGL